MNTVKQFIYILIGVLQISLLLSVNLGWEGGVYVQTCGHHLHLDCLLPYVKSLGHQQRQLSLAVDSGEYLCPLCRQLANCFLPLSPQLGKRGTIVRSPYVPFTTLLPEINNLLKEVQRNPSTVSISKILFTCSFICSLQLTTYTFFIETNIFV